MSAYHEVPHEVLQALADLFDGRSLNGTDPRALTMPWRRLLVVTSSAAPDSRLAAFRHALIGEEFASEDEHSALLSRVRQLRPGEPKTRPDDGESGAPPLPAVVQQHLRHDCPSAFVNAYLDYAGTVAPMTPEIFHQSAALWLPSMVVARRLCLPLSYATLYPNLFVLWDAPTSIYHKTSGIDLARGIARRHFNYLLAPEDVTHESFLADLAGVKPTNYDQMEETEQEEWLKERNYASQRSILLDEMAGLLASAGRDYNAGLLECFLRLYDCDSSYRRSTRGQGRITIRNAYLSLLGATTPDGVAEYLQAHRLWATGFWPRWALLTPEAGPVYARSGEMHEPAGLASTLHRLHARLGPSHDTLPREPLVMRADREVFALADLVSEHVGHRMCGREITDDRLFGYYGRLPTQALKVAMLLATLDWAHTEESAPRITMDHYRFALAVMERWRLSGHRALQERPNTGKRAVQDAVLRQVQRAHPHGITLRDLSRAMRSRDGKEIREAVNNLKEIGLIEELHQAPGPKGGRPSDVFIYHPE